MSNVRMVQARKRQRGMVCTTLGSSLAGASVEVRPLGRIERVANSPTQANYPGAQPRVERSRSQSVTVQQHATTPEFASWDNLGPPIPTKEEEAHKEVLAKQSIANKIALVKPTRLVEKPNASQRDAMLANTPLPRLLTILPDAVGSKAEFLSEIEQYQLLCREREGIRLRDQIERADLAKANTKRKRRELRKKTHSLKLKGAMVRVQKKEITNTFLGWRAHTRKMNTARRMCKNILQSNAKDCWRAWSKYVIEWKFEKHCAACAIQSVARRKLAYKKYSYLHLRSNAATKICTAARMYLVKQVIVIVRKKTRMQDQIVEKSLLILSGKNTRRFFHAWVGRVKIMQKVRRMSRNFGARLLEDCWLTWRKTATMLRRVRIKRAQALMQRIARGYLVRKRLAQHKLERDSARFIQCRFRVKKARRLVEKKAHQRRIVVLKAQRMMAGTIQHGFMQWVTFTSQRKVLKRIGMGTRLRRLLELFGRWTERRPAAICMQRMWRGYVGKRIANKLRLDNMVLGINVEEATDVQAQRLFALFELSHVDKLESANLTRLESELRTVLESSLEYYELSIHGTEQRFDLPKHRDFLLAVLEREYKKEMGIVTKARSKEHEKEDELVIIWTNILEKYIRSGVAAPIEECDTYFNAGKTFSLHIVDAQSVKDTLGRWQEMLKVGLVTRPVLLNWVVEGVLLGASVKNRKLVWDAVCGCFDRDMATDLAALTLWRLNQRDLSST